MFQLFSSVSQGMFLVDRSGRIVWVNDGYQRFLPALGFSSVDQFVGRMVEEVIPNTQMRKVLETGQRVLIDLLTNRAGTFVVSRIPLRDDAERVIGGIGTIYGSVIGVVLFLVAQSYLQDVLRMGSEAASALPWLSALLSPDRWLLWLGVLFVLSVYYFPTGVVGRLRAAAAQHARAAR
ncbi:MAG: PAS domain-containing protein [Acidovorax sp.]